MTYIINHKPCEGCNDMGMQMQDEGPMMGYVRPCIECAVSYETYIKKYGTDKNDGHPTLYYDMTNPLNPMVAKVNPKKDYIVMPDGTERYIDYTDPFEEVNKKYLSNNS